MKLSEFILPTYKQMLGGLAGVLEKGAEHCAKEGLDPDKLAQTRLAQDMQPLSYQVFSSAYHSAGAVDSLRAARFVPPSREPINRYADLQEIVATALMRVEALDPAEVDAFSDGEVLFETEKFRLKFSSMDFITTFSLPNFYFHATTTYDILRMEGVNLIKMNYLGEMRLLERSGI